MSYKPLAAAALVLGLAAAGCGGGDDSSSGPSASTPAASTASSSSASSSSGASGSGTSGGGGKTIAVAADPSGQLKYTKTQLQASAGKDTISFNNPASLPHDVVIADSSNKVVARTKTITKSSATATADLKAGTYTFYCSVPGHRQAGMQGTLTVK